MAPGKCNHKNSQLEILSGWKQIADYLQKGIRTVQRYEHELGLPVRRPARKSRGSVVATKAELAGWISTSPIRETFRLSQSTVDNHGRRKEFHRLVEELQRLRGQAAQLREEMNVTWESLRASIETMSQQQVLSSSPEHQLPADGLSFDPKSKGTRFPPQ